MRGFLSSANLQSLKKRQDLVNPQMMTRIREFFYQAKRVWVLFQKTQIANQGQGEVIYYEQYCFMLYKIWLFRSGENWLHFGKTVQLI